MGVQLGVLGVLAVVLIAFAGGMALERHILRWSYAEYMDMIEEYLMTYCPGDGLLIDYNATTGLISVQEPVP